MSEDNPVAVFKPPWRYDQSPLVSALNAQPCLLSLEVIDDLINYYFLAEGGNVREGYISLEQAGCNCPYVRLTSKNRFCNHQLMILILKLNIPLTSFSKPSDAKQAFLDALIEFKNPPWECAFPKCPAKTGDERGEHVCAHCRSSFHHRCFEEVVLSKELKRRDLPTCPVCAGSWPLTRYKSKAAQDARQRLVEEVEERHKKRRVECEENKE